MARAETTYNSPNCVCGRDHDQLAHIVGAVLSAMRDGHLEGLSTDTLFTDPRGVWDLGEAVASAAHRVGWVKAGDELEDLRQLTDGMAGLNEVDVKFPSRAETAQAGETFYSGASEIPPPGMYGLAVNNAEDLLMIAEIPETDDDPANIIMTIALNDEIRMSLAVQLLDSVTEEQWDEYQENYDDGEDDY